MEDATPCETADAAPASLGAESGAEIGLPEQALQQALQQEAEPRRSQRAVRPEQAPPSPAPPDDAAGADQSHTCQSTEKRKRDEGAKLAPTFSQIKSSGELVTEVDGVQLYLSKQSATGYKGVVDLGKAGPGHYKAQTTQGGVRPLGFFGCKVEAALCYANWAKAFHSGVGGAGLVAPTPIKKKPTSRAHKSKGAAVTKFFAARKQRPAAAGGARTSSAEMGKRKRSKPRVPAYELTDDDDGSGGDDDGDGGYCAKSTGFGIACVECHRSKYACHGFPCARSVRLGFECVPRGGVSVAEAAAAAAAHAAAAAKRIAKSRPRQRNPSAGPAKGGRPAAPRKQGQKPAAKRTKPAAPARRSRTSHAMVKAVREQLSAMTKSAMMEAEEEELAANTLMAASAVCELPPSRYSDEELAAPLQWQRARPAPHAQGDTKAVSAAVAQPSHAAVEGLLSLLSPRKLAPRVGPPCAPPPSSSPVGFPLLSRPQDTTASCRSSSMTARSDATSDPTAKHIVFALDACDQSPSSPSRVLPLPQPGRPLASQQPLGLGSAPAMEGALPSLSSVPLAPADGSVSGLCYLSALAASQSPLRPRLATDMPPMRPAPPPSALPPYLCLPTALPRACAPPPYPPLRWRPALAGAPSPLGPATLAASSVASMAVAVGKAALGAAAAETAEASFDSAVAGDRRPVGHSLDMASAPAPAPAAEAAAAAKAAEAAATTPRPRGRGVATLPTGTAPSPRAPPSQLLAQTRPAARGQAPPLNFASAKIASAQLQAQLHAQLHAQLQAPSPTKTDAPPDDRLVSHAPAAAV